MMTTTRVLDRIALEAGLSGNHPVDVAALLLRVVERLDHLEQGQQRILRALEALTPPTTSSRLSVGDHAALVALLPPIAGAVGDRLVTVHDLFASDRPAVRVALAHLSARRLGRLFARGVGTPIGTTNGELLIERAGRAGKRDDLAHRVGCRFVSF